MLQGIFASSSNNEESIAGTHPSASGPCRTARGGFPHCVPCHCRPPLAIWTGAREPQCSPADPPKVLAACFCLQQCCPQVRCVGVVYPCHAMHLESAGDGAREITCAHIHFLQRTKDSGVQIRVSILPTREKRTDSASSPLKDKVRRTCQCACACTLAGLGAASQSERSNFFRRLSAGPDVREARACHPLQAGENY